MRLVINPVMLSLNFTSTRNILRGPAAKDALSSLWTGRIAIVFSTDAGKPTKDSLVSAKAKYEDNYRT